MLCGRLLIAALCALTLSAVVCNAQSLCGTAQSECILDFDRASCSGTPSTPYCDGDNCRCVASCASDLQCNSLFANRAGTRCLPDGNCGCNTNLDCFPTVVCEDDNRCGCRDSNDCGGASCDTSTGACLACSSNSDCGSGYCFGSTCVECIGNNDCSGSQICSSGSCVGSGSSGCVTDNDCGSSTPICSSSVCVQCATTQDCSGDLTCQGGACSSPNTEGGGEEKEWYEKVEVIASIAGSVVTVLGIFTYCHCKRKQGESSGDVEVDTFA